MRQSALASEPATGALKDVAIISAATALSASTPLWTLRHCLRDRLAYSAKEVQAFLGIGETLIYDLLAQKKTRHVKARRRILVPKASLDEFLATEWVSD